MSAAFVKTVEDVGDAPEGAFVAFSCNGVSLAADRDWVGNEDVPTKTIKRAIKAALGPGAADVTRMPKQLEKFRHNAIQGKKRTQYVGKKAKLQCRLEKIEAKLDLILAELQKRNNND
jgi:hypothetical protein